MTKTRTSATFFPPVMEARRWLEGVIHPADRPLINVSQAAPVDPPVKELRQAMADAALNDDSAHLYGPVLGNAALRQALAEAGHRASTTVAGATLGAMTPEPIGGPRVYQMDRPSMGSRSASYQSQAPGFAEMTHAYSGQVVEQEQANETPPEALPLGTARCQVHENYMIAQTATGMVIVDQHAAHERLVYEKLKNQMAVNGVAAQALLIPEIVELSDGDCARLLEVADELARFGLGIEPFGGGAIAIRETPAILGEVNARAMILDILDELADQGSSNMVQAKVEAILSRVACHGSIRSGRWMRAEEMNALLREMEATPHSGQCNHGRPTYVELKLADIERLFGRT